MALTLETAARNAACDATVDLIDAGAGANGTVEIIDSDGSTVLATFALPNPAFGAAATGVATANSITSTTWSASGTAATYKVKDTDGNLLWTGTCGTSGANMIMNTTSAVSGGAVQITSWTHTVPAS